MENIKVRYCKYCLREIPACYYCCKSCFEDFEADKPNKGDEE